MAVPSRREEQHEPRPWTFAGLRKMKEVGGRGGIGQGRMRLERYQGAVILHGLGARNKEFAFYCNLVWRRQVA